ncbi:MAG: homoserine dehydrogenase [Candidatus Nezhaarchaeota archaeon]|nr:homoserine dehydrogenase [Candidatus Nezhaarchaeota archaeon]
MNKLSTLLVGFGVVGRGFTELLLESREVLANRFGVEVKVVGICDLKWGTIINEDGLDLKRALSIVEGGRRLDIYDLPAKRDLSNLEAIRETASDTVVEVTWTNIETGEPGLTHIREALNMGKNVATTNKGPIALAYRELMSIAKAKNVKLRFEGTVLSGTPTFNLRWYCLAAQEVKAIRGIVNGVTNFILSEMESGISYEEALRKAQELGYAEADPSLDVDGWDAAAKTAILANVLMGADLKPQDVKRRGIRGLTVREVLDAMKRGFKIKLLAEISRNGGSLSARVSPELVPLTDVFASVSGVLNALRFETEALGEVTIIGAGAGGKPTGYALLNDLLDIANALPRR